MVWFGWGQENPPTSWRIRLGFGSVVSLLVFLAGYLPGHTTLAGCNRAHVRGCVQEFRHHCGHRSCLCRGGAAILAWRHKQEYTAAWIAFVVGAHFLPLVWIFQDNGPFLLVVLVCAAAIVAALRAKKMGIAVSALTGAGVGVVILGFAVRGLVLTPTQTFLHSKIPIPRERCSWRIYGRVWARDAPLRQPLPPTPSASGGGAQHTPATIRAALLQAVGVIGGHPS